MLQCKIVSLMDDLPSFARRISSDIIVTTDVIEVHRPKLDMRYLQKRPLENFLQSRTILGFILHLRISNPLFGLQEGQHALQMVGSNRHAYGRGEHVEKAFVCISGIFDLTSLSMLADEVEPGINSASRVFFDSILQNTDSIMW